MNEKGAGVKRRVYYNLLLICMLSCCACGKEAQTEKEGEKPTLSPIVMAEVSRQESIPEQRDNTHEEVPEIKEEQIVSYPQEMSYEMAALSDVHYEEVVVERILQMENEIGQGVSVDLNGDGAPEKIYAAKEGLYINDCCYSDIIASDYRYDTVEELRRWWFIDIDENDGQLELLFLHPSMQGYDLFAYTDTVQKLGEWLATEEEITESLKFVDDKTISVLTPVYALERIRMSVCMQLDASGALKIAEQEYSDFEKIPLATLQSIKLYQERDLSSDYMILEAPRLVFIERLYGTNWNYITTKNGEISGWIYSEVTEQGVVVNKEKIREEYFDGFSSAD